MQVATDAVLVVDARTLVIKEADATASDLLAHGEPLCGQPALHPFDAASRGPVRELLLNARSTGRPAEIHARLAGDSHAMVVSAAPFRARDGMRLLLRVRPLGAASAGGAETRRVLAWRAERLREAVVVTDSGGKVLAANPPFLRLVQASDETTVRGRPLADWLDARAGAMQFLQARERGDLWSRLFDRGFLDDPEPATVTGITANGLRVRLPRLGVTGFVTAERALDLPAKQRGTLTVDPYGLTTTSGPWQVGSRVAVRFAGLDPTGRPNWRLGPAPAGA